MSLRNPECTLLSIYKNFFLFRYYKKSRIQFTVISQLIIKKFWNLSIFLERLGWSKKFSFRKIHGHFRKLAKPWIVPSLFSFTCCHSINPFETSLSFLLTCSHSINSLKTKTKEKFIGVYIYTSHSFSFPFSYSFPHLSQFSGSPRF